MSMFDDIVFDESVMLDEGEQAEKYLKKKSGDEYDKQRSYSKHAAQRRKVNGTDHVENNPAYKTGRDLASHRDKYGDVMPKNKSKSEKDYDKALSKAEKQDADAGKMVNKMFFKNPSEKHTPAEEYSRSDVSFAHDAAKRHLRRHPKQEAALAMIADYEPEYNY